MRSLCLLVCVFTIGGDALARNFTELEVKRICLGGEKVAPGLPECLALANKGNPAAAYYMGVHYERIDREEARRWLKLAIALGDPYDAERELYRIDSAAWKGLLETSAAWVGILLVLVPLVLACRKQEWHRVCGHRFLLLYPYPLMIASLLLHVANSDWGALKHPWLFSLAQHLPASWLVIGVAASYLPVGAFLLRAQVLPRKHVVGSLVLFYCICLLLVALAILHAMAGSASQGAGK